MVGITVPIGVDSFFQYIVISDTYYSEMTTVMQGFWAILPSSLAPEYTSLV
jgi:hypothetical protein